MLRSSGSGPLYLPLWLLALLCLSNAALDSPAAFQAEHQSATEVNETTASAVSDGDATGTALPTCSIILHLHVQRAGGTYVRRAMESSAALGDWEVVGPPVSSEPTFVLHLCCTTLFCFLASIIGY